MNVRRFTARTSRDALALVREAFGEDAVVLSTKPCDEGVAVLAMAPEGMQQIEQLSAAPAPARIAAPAQKPAGGLRARLAQSVGVNPAPAAARSRAGGDRPEPFLSPAMAVPNTSNNIVSSVSDDVQQLAMSTLSFQDYVRERMLKRRDAALKADTAADSQFTPEAEAAPLAPVRQLRAVPSSKAAPMATPAPGSAGVLASRMAAPTPPRAPERHIGSHLDLADPPELRPSAKPVLRREPPVLRDEIRVPAEPRGPSLEDIDSARRDQQDMMNELRSMKGLIEQRFDALAFVERMHRQPGQARLIQKLFDCGFSPALVRKLAESLTNDMTDELGWASGVLERNLLTADGEPALEDQGGVYAMIGATGVGKTTSTAKLAAAFATKYGAANLGLVTLDAYRVGAHEQLRTYGRILGVPVHTAHDKASLEDLLDLLSAKKMVLIDTAGMAQRDSRTAELLDMMSHRSIHKLLVVNASAQGETIEDVLIAYRASQCRGIVLSKMDEAVKLAPALDALIRHKLAVVAVANGQRVPEDWHRLSSRALIHRALRPTAGPAYHLEPGDVNLIFTAPRQQPVGREAFTSANV